MSGAEFDARGHVLSCYPGTRVVILEELHNWINDAQCAHQVLWLHGPAGIGKSAIVQGLAEGLTKGNKIRSNPVLLSANNRDSPAFVYTD
jgi:tRNA A37 threonylcarbamoyladenosine biosynthesis protein TsaE